MPFVGGLAFVFVGMVDSGHAKVDRQISRLVHSMHVAEKVLPRSAAVALARHSTNSSAIVKKLHGRGAIGVEVVDGKEIHVATYGSDGALKTYVELSLKNGELGADDLDTVRQSLAEDFGVQPDAPAPVATPAPRAAPKVETAEPAAPVDDTEAAPGISNAAPASDAEVHAHADTSGGGFRAGASLGLGAIARDFSTPPMTVKGLSSTPVPTVAVEGHLQPTARTRLALVGESTLVMHSAMANGSLASSSISRWEGTFGYSVTGGNLEIAPAVGVGTRSFGTDSTDTTRSPDSNYTYLMAGVNAAVPLGGRFLLRGNAFFEPSVGGDQSTTMTLGDASRWAIAVGTGLEMHYTHVFARAGIDWQRWSWTWANNPGAVDSYLSGSVSVGADY